MAVICPTVTAFSEDEYRAQMELVQQFAKRIHIDLMDGDFAPTVSPPLDKVWWPPELVADIHIMYRRPADHLERLVELKPNLVVFHAEAEVDHAAFAAKLHDAGIKTGLGVLQDTTINGVKPILDSFDHVMIFSGNLGHHGGSAVDFGLLDKVREVRQLYPQIEIAWDGGINDQNARQLVEGGIDVLNVGGFIHKAEDPRAAYEKLNSLIEPRLL
ncbi:MAG TPA: hypothetical protein VMU97_02270 [Candidatus Dormibacteraeota bacterium]|nr:hypothetical protein [Candidatus Dormibacteraeota bacterium]